METLVDAIAAGQRPVLKPFEHELLDVNQSGELLLNGQRLGFIGNVSASTRTQFGLRAETCVVELDMGCLEKIAVLIPIHENQSLYPSVTRDFNLIMDNAVRWSEIEQTVRSSGGQLLEDVRYRETFRDEKKDGPDKKRVLLSVTLRSPNETLTGEQADAVSKQIIDDCQQNHGAALLG